MALTRSRIDRILERENEHECSGVGEGRICARMIAIADLPTRFGQFQIAAFSNNRDSRVHVAVMRGDVFDRENVPVRVHSSCLTGDALGSMRCDCRDQLEASLRFTGARELGLVLYLRQEGRGIGLLNKIRAYGLQDRGLDTVEANRALGFLDDEREYSVAAHMLKSLRVRSIELHTNNPRKVEELSRYGIRITRRVPHTTPPNAFNRFYLETKATKSGHFLDFSGEPQARVSRDAVQPEGSRAGRGDREVIRCQS